MHPHLKIHTVALSLFHKMISWTNCKNDLGTESYGLVLLFISTVLFSIMGVFLKMASDTGIPSTELVFFRAVFQGFFVVIGLCTVRNKSSDASPSTMVSYSAMPTSPSSPSSLLTSSDEEKNTNLETLNDHESSSSTSTPPSSGSTGRLLIFNPFGNTNTEIRVVAMRGFFGGCGFIFYYYSISVLPLGDAMTLFSLTPIQTLFLAKIFLNEQIKYNQIIATIASVVGAMLIAGPSFLTFASQDEETIDANANANANTDIHEMNYNPLGYLTALLGSFFGAFVIILIRKAGTLGVDALQLLFSWCTFGVFFSLVFRLVFHTIEGLPWQYPSSTESWRYSLGMCFFGTLAHFFFNYGGRLAPAGLASVVRSSGILMAYLWEVVIFGEVPRLTTICGVIFVLLSLTIVAMQKWSDEKKEIVSTTTTGSRCCSDESITETIELTGRTSSNEMPDNSSSKSSEANNINIQS